MSIELKEAEHTIESAHYKAIRCTSKIIEYVSPKHGRILYLRKNQGLPDHADIMLHPDTDTTLMLIEDEVTPNKRVTIRFSDHETAFPKRPNKSKQLKHCGKALYVFSTTALLTLCEQYDV